jgi:phosphatidylglycerophosphate synthase
VLIVARELVAIELRARSTQPLSAGADGKVKTALQVAAVAAILSAAAWPAAGLATVANGVLVAASALTVLSGVRLVLRAKQTTADPA